MFFYYSDDFFEMLIFICIAAFVASIIIRMLSRRKASSATAQTSASKPQAVPKNQMAEDIKATKTSQVVDAVSILDDLGTTSSNYRHYCELVGTSMASGGVTAPYSRRQVAYYDIKCYRLDATYGGGQEETLVAHEHSFDPFFFTDASCDTPVYVDLESFGNNVILVNSTNHIEGPNSDFAKAFQKNASAATSSGGAAYAMVANAVSRGANALLGAVDAIRSALSPRPVLQPAYALAGGGSLVGGPEGSAIGSNVMLADPDSRGRGGGSRGRVSHGGSRGGGSHDDDSRGRSGGRGYSSQPQISINFGYGNRPPQHMGDFMGGYGGGPWVMGGGYGHPRPVNDPSSAEVLLGMGLGALLNSMTTAQQQAAQGYTTSTDTFRGYRLVENVVPLGSPIYCIGEIYRNGTDVYMGRSLAKDYPTSYFATKPESEVLSAIGSR